MSGSHEQPQIWYDDTTHPGSVQTGIAGIAEAVVVVTPTEMVVPGTGELVDLGKVGEVGRAILAIRQLEADLAHAKRALTEALVERSVQEGKKTLYDENVKVTVKGGKSKSYDATAIEAGLREAGMSEERLREIVRETVSYSVSAVEAKRAAGANDAYAKVIDANTTTYEKQSYVEIGAA